ncbi:RNA polymerase recycling motor ATPase HelR [Demequina zhanjiangensis]|uniref:RNA polymerase recycling motor ATPase HelR n=1 Tax=Demequina zhanjiangensis TaxID=3051659 RepID=A0ABT8G048_9MICO|nr:RNA polymerase recycling motor ATPase HelR [Demequina sp. SYSU T00b26]MDN4472510.1 RNA polymerase recycling motor ATPase HelR [Demequina sp. SYSU T00b26]
MSAPIFDLESHPAHKADPAAVEADEAHLVKVRDALDWHVADLRSRLAAEFEQGGGAWQGAVEREQTVQYLGRRLRALERYGAELCLGRFTTDDGGAVYIGRLGLTDAQGARLLYDWRSGAAEPFFGATAAHPMGVVTRRRFRWRGGRIVDHWDEAVNGTAVADDAALDDDSALLASLGESRTTRMRDVLATIQSDQDAIVRADSSGVLVVDGGPGTGKTVVALHRAAFLNYSDARLRAQGGKVLVVGPHRPYLEFIADVLPSLGEESVQTCTYRDLVVEGADAVPEEQEAVRLKADLDLAIDAAVRLYEEPPTDSLVVDAGETEVRIVAPDWAEAFEAPTGELPHNAAREEVWTALLDIVARAVLGEDLDDHEDADEFDAYGLSVTSRAAEIRRAAGRDQGLRDALGKAWPILDPQEVVGDLLSVPAYLRMCAPWLTPDQVASLQRDEPARWTDGDLPVLDAARARIGDPHEPARKARQRAARAAERARMDDVVADLVDQDDSEMGVMSMLRGQDLMSVLDTDEGGPGLGDLSGPFAHVIVDEAQELTDGQWRSLMRRCPSGSFTVVGDRAQARAGFPEAWEDRLSRVGLTKVRRVPLTVNYRTPEEVMAEAAPVIQAVLPDANVPVSVRAGGHPVVHGSRADLDGIVDGWLQENSRGVACVIGDPAYAPRPRVSSLSPALAKGLEFDLVVLVDPAAFGDDVAGAVDRYVAMTRSTSRLVVLDA